MVKLWAWLQLRVPELYEEETGLRKLLPGMRKQWGWDSPLVI